MYRFSEEKYTVAQSICILYSSLSGQGLELYKNQVQNMDLKKAVPKKQGQCYSKREDAAWPFFFLNNNDPVFCNQLFSGPYFGPDFFQGHKPTHVFKTRIMGAD